MAAAEVVRHYLSLPAVGAAAAGRYASRVALAHSSAAPTTVRDPCSRSLPDAANYVVL